MISRILAPLPTGLPEYDEAVLGERVHERRVLSPHFRVRDPARVSSLHRALE
jgi:hypothetical protein